MSYPIIFSNTAAKQFQKIKDNKLKERLALTIEHISAEPARGKPLQAELKGYYAYRVGNYRIMYILRKERKCIGIIKIDHRREIYR